MTSSSCATILLMIAKPMSGLNSACRCPFTYVAYELSLYGLGNSRSTSRDSGSESLTRNEFFGRSILRRTPTGRPESGLSAAMPLQVPSMVCACAAPTSMIEADAATRTERTRIVPPAEAFGGPFSTRTKPARHEDFLNDLKVLSVFKPNGLRDDPTISPPCREL